jgi:hypothetical protein
MAYTKLFSSIITSTIWTEDDQTRLVWITMLAIADKNGEVAASLPGLARLAAVPLDAVERAIEKFLSPDKHSRTKDDEGRRIEEIDGGWLLLNHAKYREMASRDEAKAASAERQKRFKERKKRNAKVTEGNGEVTADLHIADTDSEADPSRKGKGCGTSVPHARSGFKKGPKYPYPTSQEEMYKILEESGIEPNPDRDGHFYDQMATNGWTINGEKVWDWKATYEARVQNSEDSCKRP